MGHRFSEWKPNAVGVINFSFVHGAFLVFNLIYTIFFVQRAFLFLKQMSLRGSSLLYVESSVYSISTLKSAAGLVNVSYIVSSWIGGTLTNFKETVHKLLKKKINVVSKRLRPYRQGISNLEFIPEIIISASEFHSPFVIQESNTLLLPTIAVVDSNAKTVESTYPILLNDDSFPTIKYTFFIFSSSYWLGRSDFAVRHLNLSIFYILTFFYSIEGKMFPLKKINDWLVRLRNCYLNLSSNFFNRVSDFLS